MTDTTFWFITVGAILLSMGLLAAHFKRIPATFAMVYLAIGFILGPTGFGLYHINPLKHSALLEILTEIGVLISLFAAGVKMPVPFRVEQWRAPIRLASLSMVFTVILVALYAHQILALPLGAAVLLGAIMAPTDPVLATDVQIRHPGDNDELRFSLTSEAGLNDGSAFPFVMLGLGLLGLNDLGTYGSRWLLIDVLWATISAICIGILCGATLARAAHQIRKWVNGNPFFYEDFLGLGLIALTYGLSLLIDAWGFLAVFSAAVALRQTETRLAANFHKTAEESDTLAEGFDTSAEGSDNLAEGSDNLAKGPAPAPKAISEASLVFKEHLERLSEVLLILLVGGTLFVDSWSWQAVGFALFIFLIARPVSVYVGLLGSGASRPVRRYASWFGVRGIGSLYYLMYAIEHGLPDALALELTQLVLIVVALSIFVHGATVKPLIRQYGLHKRARALAKGETRFNNS